MNFKSSKLFLAKITRNIGKTTRLEFKYLWKILTILKQRINQSLFPCQIKIKRSSKSHNTVHEVSEYSISMGMNLEIILNCTIQKYSFLAIEMMSAPGSVFQAMKSKSHH